jgi:uncharacterized protein (TIGR02118 family)
MIQVTVLYGQPQDLAAFDRYYREVHAPLAKKLPGLKGYTSNKPASINPQRPFLHSCLPFAMSLGSTCRLMSERRSRREHGAADPEHMQQLPGACSSDSSSLKILGD